MQRVKGTCYARFSTAWHSNHCTYSVTHLQISPQENIASFSSFGALAFSDREVRETQDLRTQPTVVAPGVCAGHLDMGAQTS